MLASCLFAVLTSSFFSPSIYLMAKTKRKNAQSSKLICKICKSEFSDGWTHALKQSNHSPFLVPIDKAHSIVSAIPEHGEACPLCDSRVDHIGVGYEGWEVRCSGCDFMFDED